MYGMNRGIKSKPRGHRSPVDDSPNKDVIVSMLLYSNKYRMMSGVIKEQLGEDISPRALKHYREYRLKDKVKEIKLAREQVEGQAKDTIARIEVARDKGLKIIRASEISKREHLKQLGEHLETVSKDIEERSKVAREVGDKAKADTEETNKVLRALTDDLKTGVEHLRKELSAEVDIAGSMNWVFNCTLLALEARIAMMQKVPVVSPQMIPELRMAMEMLEKIRGEQIALGKHPRLLDSNMPRGMFVGGHQYFGQQQQIDKRRVKVIVNRETAAAALKLLAAKAELHKVEFKEEEEENE